MEKSQNISIFKIIILYLLGFGLNYPICIGVVSVLIKYLDVPKLTILQSGIIQGISAGIYILPLLYILKQNKISGRKIRDSIEPIRSIKDILFIITIGVTCGIMGYAFARTIIFVFIKKLNTVSEIITKTPENITLSYLLITCLLAIIIAPVVEEITFKFGIFNKLISKHSLIKSTLLVSFLFMLFHPDINKIGAFMVSVITCIIYYKTKNLLFPIGVHMTNNTITTLPTIKNYIMNTNSVLSNHDILEMQAYFQGISVGKIIIEGMLMVLIASIASYILIKIRFKGKSQ